jgi:hypothetical protein
VKYVQTIMCVVAALGLSSSGYAATCSIPANEQQDALYAANWGCSQSWIDDSWSRFDFHKEDWDDGFGYDDVCNDATPLKRTLNALHVMAFGATSTPTCSTSESNMAKWAHCWAGNQIDELDGRCGSPTGAFAKTWFGVQDNRTELYEQFFANKTPVQRAATIQHEARHAHGWCQHDKTGCPAGSDCEQSFTDGCHGAGSGSGGGAFRYHVLYINWIVTTARTNFINSAVRTAAINEANGILSSRFVTNPCITLNSQGFVVSTC